MPIYTHDQIDLTTGVLAATGVLWGGNAIQSITIGRHTPKNPQQAVGYLGVVDYTRGIITSDLSIDCILTEQTSLAADTTSVYDYAAVDISVGAEEYVLVSCGINLSAGNPIGVSYGYLTSSLASALATQVSPAPSGGEESPFAVMMGDDGSGVLIYVVEPDNTSWSAQSTAGGGVSYIDPYTGALSTMVDGGIPAGLQSLSFNGRINRDNVLDVRSVVPAQFVTTYPLDVTVDMELYVLPADPIFSRFKELVVKGAGREFRPGSGGSASGLAAGFAGQVAKAIDLTKLDEQETVSVGRYRGFTFNYMAADLQIPLEVPA